MQPDGNYPERDCPERDCPERDCPERDCPDGDYHVDCYLVYVTAPPADAARLAQVIVEQQLAACVNIIPTVRSIYRWKGALCDDSEALLVIKTSKRRLSELEAVVLERHPYDVPEFIAVPIVQGHGPYLRWINANTAGGATDEG